MIEIDKEHFCSFAIDDVNPCVKGQCLDCPHYHHKWPTLEQFEEEYGIAIRTDKDRAQHSYYHQGRDGVWFATAAWYDDNVIACTPYGKPPDDWRPE